MEDYKNLVYWTVDHYIAGKRNKYLGNSVHKYESEGKSEIILCKYSDSQKKSLF